MDYATIYFNGLWPATAMVSVVWLISMVFCGIGLFSNIPIRLQNEEHFNDSRLQWVTNICIVTICAVIAIAVWPLTALAYGAIMVLAVIMAFARHRKPA